jgi:hypothetical protein
MDHLNNQSQEIRTGHSLDLSLLPSTPVDSYGAQSLDMTLFHQSILTDARVPDFPSRCLKLISNESAKARTTYRIRPNSLIHPQVRG